MWSMRATASLPHLWLWGSRPARLRRAYRGEATGAFLELAQDISTNLRGLLQVDQEWLTESTEQQRDFVLASRGLDRTLADLADTLAAVRLPLG